MCYANVDVDINMPGPFGYSADGELQRIRISVKELDHIGCEHRVAVQGRINSLVLDVKENIVVTP